MFKLESYVTPYIFAYLGKYFKNFDPSDFQMSLWGGGAVFQNLNLDLEVLDQELCLPVTFVSGHIHELKISVPWTKVTSEPIQVSINTIEITLKLKSLEEKTDGFSEGNKPQVSRKMEVDEPSAGSPPPGYMHNLISKIITNVHVNFENVIVKYVEEDIVLSLNIKRASYSTTDSEWISSFVDLSAPNFELRKKFEISDLTICLDKSNTAGKIETYQEPLLYKCSFAVRIFQQFKTAFSKIAHFTRMDFLLDDMDFSITDEQVPMMMRLYYLFRSLFEINLKTVPLNAPSSCTTFGRGVAKRDSGSLDESVEDEGGEEDGSLLDWGSWAISWLPPISAVLGEETEDGVAQPEPEDEDKSNFICHYGFYVDNLAVTFKALERICDKPSYGRTIKVKFLPFLKLSLQGITSDFVIRGDEANYVFGVSHITVDPVGFCPCGIVDGRIAQEKSDIQKTAQYIRVGRCSSEYSKTSMFSNSSDVLLLFDYNFQYNGHVEAFSEEMMLERTPAFAVEYLQTRNSLRPRISRDESQNYYEDTSDETINMGKDKLLTRVILAPCYVAVCSGLVHRLKMIRFAVDSYDYEPYGKINRLMNRRIVKDRVAGPLDLSQFHNFEDAYDIYQFTVIRPQIEVWAADHPEYNFESREKHLDHKRRIKTGTPFSHFVPNWPKLLLVAECIDGKMMDPNMKFRSLVARTSADSNSDVSTLPLQLTDSFRTSLEFKVFGFEVSLVAGPYLAKLCSPCSLKYFQKEQNRLINLNQDNLNRISEKNFTTDAVNFRCSWVELLVTQVIVVSTIQNVEKISEHLLASSLLNDLPRENRSRLVIEIGKINFLRIITAFTLSDRLCMGSCKIELEGSDIRGQLPVCIAPSILDQEEDTRFAFILIQRPLQHNLSLHEETKEEKWHLVPVFIMKLLEFKIYYYKEILCWMNYRPEPIECVIPPSVRMRSDVKVPLRPSSRSSSRDGSWRSEGRGNKAQTLSSSDERTSAPATVSEMDGGGGAHIPSIETDKERRTKESIADSHGSSQGGSIKSSIPGYQLPPRKEMSWEAEMEEQERNVGNKWELWFLSHLNVMKNTFVHLDVGQAELWFPLKSPYIAQTQQRADDSIFIKFPKIHSQPQSFKLETDFDEMTLPLQLDYQHLGRDLFPHRISLDNMYFATVVENVGTELCSVPLSVLVTFSLSTKGKEQGSVITTACIHTDIAVLDVGVSYSQVVLFIELVEQLLDSAVLFKNLSGSFLLPPVDPDEALLDGYNGDKSLPDTKSEASSYAMSTNSAAKTKSNFEKDPSLQFQTSYESSIPGSGSEYLNPETIGTDQSVQNSLGGNDEVKVTCWIQMTVGTYRFSVCSPNLDYENGPVEKLVFQAEDIVSSLDIQSVFIKWSHKVSNIRLRNYEKKTLSDSSSDEWVPGRTLGVVISSGEEITREIQIYSSSFNTMDIGNCTPSISLPINSDGGNPAHQKMRGSITMTFTRVQSTNFHKKSGVPSPISKWKAAVYKFAEKDYELYAPYDEEDMRSLSEIDIQIKAIDFVFDPLVISLYADIINRILKVQVPEDLQSTYVDATERCVVPPFSNNTLPLIYLKTEAIRVFLKSSSPDKKFKGNFKSNTPDFILLESSAISIVSQTDNPLNRTVVRPILFQMAEKARILGVPGSPVEDRQYQVDFQGVAISTGFWKEVHAKSQQTNLRSSVLLKTQGENPALEWNIRTVEMAEEDVKTYPLLDRMEFSIGLAPAMVYERSYGNPCKSFIVAGHALEVNVVSDIKVNLNLQQLASIQQFYTQTSEILEKLTQSHRSFRAATSNSSTHKMGEIRRDEEDHCRSRGSSLGEFDSGIDSLAHLPKIARKATRRAEDTRKKPKGALSPSHKHWKDMVPLDALVTSGMTTITFYDIKFNRENQVERIIPLGLVTVTQPHFVISASQRLQKAEISVFELSVQLGSRSLDDGKMCWIPGKEKFDQKVFDSIPAERDPKTGMVPPFFTLRITDFLNRPCGVACDLSRPIKIFISQQRLNNILSLYKYSKGESSSQDQYENLKVTSSAECLLQNREKQEAVRRYLARVASVSVTLKQLAFSLAEGPAEIIAAISGANLDIRIQNRHSVLCEAENVVVDGVLNSASISTAMHKRSNVLLSPFNVHAHGDCRWKSWLEYPMMTVRLILDPVAFHIGPQNILSLHQIYHVFQRYLNTADVMEEGMVEKREGGLEPTSSKMIYDSYEDDLRAGTFKYVRVNSSAELPQVYQIGFCEADRTMTWRYPQHRVLTSIEACPVPIDNDYPSSLKKRKLDCTVEYWDDAMGEFLFYGSFSLSELEGTSVGSPSKDKLHSYISTIWRIKIETTLEEADSKHLVRPEILAACLKVNSIHDSSLVPKFKIFLQVPRVSINFVNNFYFGGRGSNLVVSHFSNDSLTHFDQQFASINLEMTSLLMSVWQRHCTVNYSSYVNFDVLDYEYLTLIRVLEPVHLKLRISLYEIEASSDTNSEVDVISKNLSIRLGASVLHTLFASLESWSQVLRGWTGSQLQLNSLKSLPSVNVNQILIFNTISNQVKLLQSGADEPTFIRGGDCVPFYWPIQKAKPICKLGMKEKDWAYTCQFHLKKSGYLVRNVHKRPVFINVAGIGGTQKLVTITGSLLVANALDENMEIATLLRDKSSEVNWRVPSRRQGPSQMISLEETEHIRFRIQTEGKSNPWSSVVTPADLKSSKSRSVCVPLFEERNGALATFSIWCSLVEETIVETTRCLIVLSPFYRVRSFLPSPTLVHISTAKQGNKENYTLEGRGVQLQIDFTGSHEVTNHLTFQSNPLGSASTPSIPLLPDGPTLEMHHVQRSIDEILSAIIEKPYNNIQTKPEEIWPFISEPISKEEEWITCYQPETDLEVEFAPWIQGLPTVLLDVRPWALIVNLCGTDLLFSLNEEDQLEDGWIHHRIPNKSVFSPSRISLQKGRFKLGLDLNGIQVRTTSLRFSEDLYRTDVHHGNVDNLIPIDSFSRIDLPTGSEIGHLTLETRFRKKVLVMTVKPTFSIANKTGQDLFLHSLSISSSKVKNQGKWNWDEDMLTECTSLKPLAEDSLMSYPLLSFNTKHDDYCPHQKNVKHLAISCGGPWWFVQLIDFAVVFNNMNSSQGVPAAAFSVTIPLKGLENKLLKWKSTKEEELESVTVPIIVSWTSKNGLVWISLSLDPFPQVVLNNQTSVPFVYVQSGGPERIPFQETEYFEQYLVLPPYSKSHYSFAQKYSEFPKLAAQKKNLPFLLLTKLPKELENLTCRLDNFSHDDSSKGQESKKIERGTLLISGAGLNWSKEVNLDGEACQYLSVGEFVDAKITVEKQGFTYYVYLENMSSVEVSAKDVRRRIVNEGYGTKIPLVESPIPLLAKSSSSLSVIPSSGSSSELDVSLKPWRKPEEYEHPRHSVTKMEESKKNSKPFWIFRCYLPSLSFVVTEDLLSSTKRRELISLCVEDFFLEQIPEPENREVRAFGAKSPSQKWVTRGRIGDIQLDSPGFPFERTCDFPVILKQEQEYKRLPHRPGSNEVHDFGSRLDSSNDAMISFTLNYSERSEGLKGVDTVHLISRPFCLNIEDRLVDFVFSSLQETYKVIQIRLPLLQANLSTQHSKEEDDVFDDALEEFLVPDSILSESERKESESAKCGNKRRLGPVGREVENYIVTDVSGSGRNLSAEPVDLISIPVEVFDMLNNFSHPIRMERVWIDPVEICLTLRMARLVYLAVDHSRLKIPQFEAVSILSTSYTVGQTLAAHYSTGAIFQIGNPMRLIGSLELLGSPGSLAESVGTGLKDFVLYPYQGMFQGPTGFLGGLGNGVTSLVKSITSGTLTSVTNWAWSVSRNIDKLTLDEEEQILTEAARRVQLDGFTEGFIEGVTGFGIRLLGAVGGIAHHPIQNVIQHGLSPSTVISGVGKGVIGVVTRPIGGIVQLVAMTGEGVLRGAGWTPQLKMKGECLVDEVCKSASSVLKYEMKMEENTPSVHLLVHAVQLDPNALLKPVSLIISTQNVYLIDVSEDLLVSHFPLSLATVERNEDKNIISLRIAPPKKKDDVSFMKERIMEFVRGNASSVPCDPIDTVSRAPSSPLLVDLGGHSGFSSVRREENMRSGLSPQPLSSSSTTMFTAISGSARSLASSSTSLYPLYAHPFESNSSVSQDSAIIGDFIVSPHDKSQFENLLAWVKMNQDDKYFKV